MFWREQTKLSDSVGSFDTNKLFKRDWKYLILSWFYTFILNSLIVFVTDKCFGFHIEYLIFPWSRAFLIYHKRPFIALELLKLAIPITVFWRYLTINHICLSEVHPFISFITSISHRTLVEIRILRNRITFAFPNEVISNANTRSFFSVRDESYRAVAFYTDVFFGDLIVLSDLILSTC